MGHGRTNDSHSGFKRGNNQESLYSGWARHRGLSGHSTVARRNEGARAPSGAVANPTRVTRPFSQGSRLPGHRRAGAGVRGAVGVDGCLSTGASLSVSEVDPYVRCLGLWGSGRRRVSGPQSHTGHTGVLTEVGPRHVPGGRVGQDDAPLPVFVTPRRPPRWSVPEVLWGPAPARV